MKSMGFAALLCLAALASAGCEDEGDNYEGDNHHEEGSEAGRLFWEGTASFVVDSTADKPTWVATIDLPATVTTATMEGDPRLLGLVALLPESIVQTFALEPPPSRDISRFAEWSVDSSLYGNQVFSGVQVNEKGFNLIVPNSLTKIMVRVTTNDTASAVEIASPVHFYLAERDCAIRMWDDWRSSERSNWDPSTAHRCKN